jgi:ankyrin repeat protein
MDFIDITADFYFTDDCDSHKMTLNDLSIINNSNKNNNNASLNAMVNLIANKNISKIRDLLESDKGIINLTDDDNENLLHYSVFSDSYELSRIFLKYGINPNYADNTGQTPIFRIAFAKDDRIIGLFLEYDALLDAQDNDGNTPLHIAVITKNYKIIKSLLDYGGDPLIYNNNNLLPMDFALSKVNGKINLDEKILLIFSDYIQ